MFYSTKPLDDETMRRLYGSECYGLGTGESHERQIQSAGGEIGYDGFKDPRPGQDGKIFADRVFIDEHTNTVKGVNFNKNGEFCCSYTGMNYQDIKDSNQKDCAQKNATTERSIFSSGEPSKTLQNQHSNLSSGESNGEIHKKSNSPHH